MVEAGERTETVLPPGVRVNMTNIIYARAILTLRQDIPQVPDDLSHRNGMELPVSFRGRRLRDVIQL